MRKLTMKSMLGHFIIMCMAVMCIVGATGQIAYAADLGSVTGSNSDGESDHNTSMSDYLQNYEPVTQENMSAAQKFASPLTALLGNVTGFICIISSALIFGITALDLLYIGAPPLRGLLYDGGQAGGMGMGGMGMQGGQQGKKKQWVSDECLQVCGQSGGQAGGMGMGGMGMSGMGMSGMSMQGGQQQGTKSMIVEYFKKRTIFVIIFFVATIMLTSTIFMDCGINVANLLFKVMDIVNNTINGAM